MNKKKVSDKPSSQKYPDRVRPLHASVVFVSTFQPSPTVPKSFTNDFPSLPLAPKIRHEFTDQLRRQDVTSQIFARPDSTIASILPNTTACSMTTTDEATGRLLQHIVVTADVSQHVCGFRLLQQFSQRPEQKRRHQQQSHALLQKVFWHISQCHRHALLSLRQRARHVGPHLRSWCSRNSF